MINYFDVLNIAENAEIEVIRSAYKALAKKYHPDNTDLPKEIAEQRMSAINEAYRVLSNEGMRREYLKKLRTQTDKKEQSLVEREQRNYEYEYKSESDNKFYYLIIFIVFVAMICCAFYFVPELLAEAWCNIQSSIEEVINTF